MSTIHKSLELTLKIGATKEEVLRDWQQRYGSEWVVIGPGKDQIIHWLGSQYVYSNTQDGRMVARLKLPGH